MANFDLLAKFVAELKQMFASAGEIHFFGHRHQFTIPLIAFFPRSSPFPHTVSENYTPKKLPHVWSLYYTPASAELINLLDGESTGLCWPGFSL